MTQSDPSPLETHLIFQSGDVWYAVPGGFASEVVVLPKLRHLPGAPPYVLGVFVHRAEVIPAVDLALLTHQGNSRGKRGVLIRSEQGVLSIIADQVDGMSEIVGTTGPLGSDGINAHLLGPACAKDRAVVVIDVPGLVQFLSRR